jgi:Tol biopolymer transport system component
VSPDGQHVVVVVRRGGVRRLVMMSADGTNVRTLAPSIEIQGTADQAAADWSPDGSWIVAGGIDKDGPALFKIPANGEDPVRIVTGQAVNPVWSPEGSLIAFGGPLVAGQTSLAWVPTERRLRRSTGRPRSCRRLSLPAKWEGSRLSADRCRTGLLAAPLGDEDHTSAHASE